MRVKAILFGKIVQNWHAMQLLLPSGWIESMESPKKVGKPRQRQTTNDEQNLNELKVYFHIMNLKNRF